MTVVSRWARSRTKRAVDTVVALLALLVLSPVFAVVAVLVLVSTGRPVFFRHPRAGKDGRPFTMVKFRSMRNERPDDDPRHPDRRITRFGRVLRGTSLDELPELWNVVRGDMSIVGPRPLLLEYNDRYDEEQALRLRVRPGLTGLAQVSGRNALSWEDKFRLDVAYVRTATPAADARIVMRTVGKVLGRDGVTVGSDVQDTPDKFMGTPRVDQDGEPA